MLKLNVFNEDSCFEEFKHKKCLRYFACKYCSYYIHTVSFIALCVHT